MLRYVTFLLLLTCADSLAGSAAPPDIYILRPISDAMVLPDTDPFDMPGRLSSSITIYAAAGEFEPASFVIRPSEDITLLRPVVSDLKTSDGRVIAARNVDIKAVKCWYQADGAWKTEGRRSFRKVLVPELLLNDDSLVRVDTTVQTNLLRMTYPSGDKYVDICQRPESDNLDPRNRAIYNLAPGIGPETDYNYVLKDSPTLLPLDVKARTNRQFWVTVAAPESASAGVYAGKIDLLTPEGSVGGIRLKVRVLPIRLSEPRTSYDLTKEFTSSIYYRGMLDPKGKGAIFGGANAGGGLDDLKSEEQFRAELRNLRRHGVTNPLFAVPYGSIANNEKLFRDILRIRKEEGITGPFFTVFDLVTSQQEKSELEAMKSEVRRLIGITREYGVPEFYFYGVDEAMGRRLLSQKAAWQAAHEAGGKVMVSGFEGTFKAMGDLLDILIWNGAPSEKEARKWHSIGHRVWCYSNPQAGIENPLVYRRRFGLSLWKTGYDGAATYAYQTEAGSWNDFNDIMRDLTFAYPTSNGVVDTIAWEGYREAIDDIRYATTLALAIQSARKAGGKAKQATAREAEEYLQSIDTNSDLDKVRLRTIDYILRLTGQGDSDGTVAHWHFDENQGAIARDSSVYSNDGIITAPHWTAGVAGSALEFDGEATSIDCGNDPVLDMSGPFSVEAWIKWTGDCDGPDQEMRGICKGRGFILYSAVRKSAPKLQFMFKVWDDVSGRYEPGAGTDFQYDPGKWYHVVGVYDGESQRVYVNGKLEVVQEKTFAPAGLESLTFGRDFGTAFRGAMDEVRIYNRALTASEIAQHYSARKAAEATR